MKRRRLRKSIFVIALAAAALLAEVGPASAHNLVYNFTAWTSGVNGGSCVPAANAIDGTTLAAYTYHRVATACTSPQNLAVGRIYVSVAGYQDGWRLCSYGETTNSVVTDSWAGAIYFYDSGCGGCSGNTTVGSSHYVSDGSNWYGGGSLGYSHGNC